ncbi:MAG TPA: DUF4214 domain-containing protein, partial [Saccharofermentans sp.]|nr:DUF4214 domain-containing protein [Saccharofermentans sp.]
CIVSAADGVAINATNFPDENFRNYVSNTNDTNSDGFLSETEIAKITSINVTDMSISTLEGIEYFTAIMRLYCYENNLTTLDVSRNTALVFLDCYGNNLTTLDVSNNTSLRGLQCAGNNLTTLDVSNNTALTFLVLNNNNLTTLDVSNNTVLESLYCGGNNLTTLDVSNNTVLESLYCGENNLTTLDVSNSTALETLYCYDNNLTTLDVSNNTALTFLSCWNNNLTTLDVSNNTVLESLNCGENNLTTLDVSNDTSLSWLYCYGNNLTTLDVSNNTSLTGLWCEGNNLTTLDVSNNTALLRVVNEGSESVVTYNGYEVRQFLDDESGLSCDLSTTIVTNPPVTEEPTSTVAPVRPSVDRTQAELFVTRCYEEALNRTPDSEGLANWTNSLVDRSLSGTQLAYGIIFSPEFQNRNLSNEDYVECLYQMFLDRPSDPAGKADWVSQLNNGASREVIFAGFVNSVEYFNLCRTYGLNAGYYMVGVDMNRQGAVNGFVDRLYGYCLGRSGDQGGQQNWVTQLINGSATGAQVAYGFFFSPEFMNNNYSNEVFVTILYNVCLNRAPDPDGLNNWVTALDNGADRLEVFRGFAHSDEFTGICNNYGIVRGSI